MIKIKSVCLFVFMLGQLSVGHAESLIAMTPQQMQTLGIAVSPIVATNAVVSNKLPGEIIIPVNQERIVSTPQSGLIDAMYFAAGQSVKRGQVVAHISSTELVALQGDYLRGKTQHQLSKNMADRDRELYKDGIIAQRRLLTTESSHQELSVELKQRRQALKMAGMGENAIAKLEKSGELASGFTLTSPIDGVVIEQLGSTGQRVDASMPIYRIAKLKPLWLEIHAPIEIVHFAKEGMMVNIPKYQASGKITTIIRNLNRNDQTVHLRAEVTVGTEKLFPGQFVEAELVSESTTRQFAVPKSAVIRNGNKSYVFVQNTKGFVPKQVVVSSEQSTQAVINGDFTGKESVAISGTVAIKSAWYSTTTQ